MSFFTTCPKCGKMAIMYGEPEVTYAKAVEANYVLLCEYCGLVAPSSFIRGNPNFDYSEKMSIVHISATTKLTYNETTDMIRQNEKETTMQFSDFKTAAAAQFAKMREQELYVVQIDPDELWNHYLDSYPAGTNEIYRLRREYDCSCCRHFIRTLGAVVSINDDYSLSSIWDIDCDDPTFGVVAKSMAERVKQCKIKNVFRHFEQNVGHGATYEQLPDGGAREWPHFAVQLHRKFVFPKDQIGPLFGEIGSTFDVCHRGLNELTMDSVETVLDLITQGVLYRGAEHVHALRAFKGALHDYTSLAGDVQRQHNCAWKMGCETLSTGVARLRNTAIGTLLIDLSTGMELEEAVSRYEKVVAPQNYKRPTALVTKSMVDAAKKTVAELGLVSALNRRYATAEDINLKHTLFVDRSVSRVQEQDVFGDVPTKANPKPSEAKEISIKDFLRDVLPTASTLEVMFENAHAGNLASLTTASDPTAEPLFKWRNNVAWSYNGDVADSIKERVKKAGGNITAELCCRLSWHNSDDLDLHMEEEHAHIYYRHRKSHETGGTLDVDMNAHSPLTREPVENIYYPHMCKMHVGTYKLSVHQFCKREDIDTGFTVEIDHKGDITTLHMDKPLRQGENVAVACLLWDGKHLEIDPKIPSASASRTMWGLQTQQWQRVHLLTTSPNFWTDAVGNLHYFFLLHGCRNEETCRGFYNEFLRTDLEKHRKVLEIVGSKVRAEQNDHQLSGLGFSSTKPASLLCRVTGKFTRVFKVNI